MLVSQATLLQQQSGNHAPRKDGLKSGLKRPGWGWFTVDFAGTKKGPYGPCFNDLETLVEVSGSQFGAGNETRTRDPDLGKVVLYQLSYSRIVLVTGAIL